MAILYILSSKLEPIMITENDSQRRAASYTV